LNSSPAFAGEGDHAQHVEGRRRRVLRRPSFRGCAAAPPRSGGPPPEKAGRIRKAHAARPESFSLLLDTLRRFVAERLRPLEAQVAEEDEVPVAVVAEMREMGLFGLSIPEEYGGLGLSMSEEVRVALELGRTSPAFRSVFGTNVGIGSQGLVMADRKSRSAIGCRGSRAARSSPASH
jgi:hypothetical protein